MKLYTLQSDINIAQKRDYLYEMDKKIESLINYIDLTNPNWQIINKKYTNNSNSTLVSMVDLLKYGIIKLVWFDDKLNTCFSVNKLKLHKGLVNEYGSNTYYWLLDDDSFDGEKYTINFAKNGGAGAVIRDFDVTLASLGVEDGDGFLASENLKSA